MVADILLVAAAYLFGSFPYMLLRAKMKGYDVRAGEDLHLALLHKAGLGEGIAGIVVDFLKGILPVVAGFLLNFQLLTVAVAGLAGVAGQMWPVFLKFDGEKGNTAGTGMVTALIIGTGSSAWPVLIAGLLCMLTGLAVLIIPRLIWDRKTLIDIIRQNGPHTISLPVGMLTGFVVMPVISFITGQPVALTVVLAVLWFFIVLRRLTADLDEDLKAARISKWRMLLNRFLLDRSYVK